MDNMGGEPQGAFVGDDKTAQQIYANLQNGGVFAPKPGGNPPIGGTNVPTPQELANIEKPPVVVTKGGLGSLLVEVKELRKEIQQLLEALKGL